MNSILLADDHSIVIMGMLTILEKLCPNAKIDTANNGTEILNLTQQNNYDLMILDIKMPEFESLDFVKSVAILSPQTRIVILSGLPSNIFKGKYLAAGASLYLDKSNSPAQLAKEIELVIQDNFSKPQLTPAQQKKNKSNLSPFSKLSQQEITVVQFLIQGNSTSEIAIKMNSKPSTISTYKKRLFDKLSISSLVDLLNLVDLYEMPNHDLN